MRWRILLVFYTITAIVAQDRLFARTFYDSFEDVREHCLQETNTDAILVRQWTKEFKPPDPSVGCFMKCFALIKGYINENFEINSENLALAFGLTSVEYMHTITERCHQKRGKHDCDTAFKIFVCMRQILYKEL